MTIFEKLKHGTVEIDNDSSRNFFEGGRQEI